MSATPFKINIADEAIADLRQRLALTKFPDELEESDWDYGVPLSVWRISQMLFKSLS